MSAGSCFDFHGANSSAYRAVGNSSRHTMVRTFALPIEADSTIAALLINTWRIKQIARISPTRDASSGSIGESALMTRSRLPTVLGIYPRQADVSRVKSDATTIEYLTHGSANVNRGVP